MKNYLLLDIAEVTQEIEEATNFHQADRSLDGSRVMLKFMGGPVPENLSDGAMTATEAAVILSSSEFCHDV